MATSEAPRGTFQFLPIKGVVFGPGQVETLPAQVDGLGARRAFVTTGQSLATRTDLVRRIEALLGTRHVGTFAQARQHVPSRAVMEATRQAREAGADVLVSFGGGSSVDSAKLVALGLAEGWTEAAQWNAAADRSRRLQPSRTPLPQIAVTTTLSAAEFTSSAGVTNEETGYKGGCNHPSLAPKVVVLDPELTLSTPWQLWASTGIKALDHAVERLYSPNRQPITNVLCAESVRLLMEHLPRSGVEAPDAVARRGHCQMAAWFSIFGMASVSTGLSHALGHQLGSSRGVPHGVTSCITMPHVVRYLGRTSPAALGDLARAFGVDPDNPSVGQVIGNRIAQFVAELRLPGRLRDAGVPQDAIDTLAAHVSQEIRGRNLADAEAVRALLTAAW